MVHGALPAHPWTRSFWLPDGPDVRLVRRAGVAILVRLENPLGSSPLQRVRAFCDVRVITCRAGGAVYLRWETWETGGPYGHRCTHRPVTAEAAAEATKATPALASGRRSRSCRPPAGADREQRRHDAGKSREWQAVARVSALAARASDADKLWTCHTRHTRLLTLTAAVYPFLRMAWRRPPRLSTIRRSGFFQVAEQSPQCRAWRVMSRPGSLDGRRCGSRWAIRSRRPQRRRRPLTIEVSW
jgi:hypothetical protein